MNKILKFLSLATIFTLPLTGCGDDKDKEKEEQKEVTETALKDEAIRIASGLLGISKDKLTIADYESEDEADIYEYKKNGLILFEIYFYNDTVEGFDEVVTNVKSYLPKNSVLDEKNSAGESDYSEGDVIFKSYDEIFSKDGFGYDMYTDYYEEEGVGDSETYVDIFNYSAINVYLDLMSSSEE